MSSREELNLNNLNNPDPEMSVELTELTLDPSPYPLPIVIPSSQDENDATKHPNPNETSKNAQFKEISLKDEEEHPQIILIRSKAATYARILKICLLAAVVAYGLYVIVQSAQNYIKFDVRADTSTSDNGLEFPALMACPVMGVSTISFNNSACYYLPNGSPSSLVQSDRPLQPCSSVTKSLGAMTCVEFNAVNPAAATSTGDGMEIKADIVFACAPPMDCSLLFPTAELFFYEHDNGPKTMADVSDYLSTNFVAGRSWYSFVHIKKVEKKNIQGTVTSTSFPFTLSSSPIKNGFTGNDYSTTFYVKLTYESLTVTTYVDYVTKDWLYVIGAIGGAYSLVGTALAMWGRFTEIHIKLTKKKLKIA